MIFRGSRKPGGCCMERCIQKLSKVQTPNVAVCVNALNITTIHSTIPTLLTSSHTYIYILGYLMDYCAFLNALRHQISTCCTTIICHSHMTHLMVETLVVLATERVCERRIQCGWLCDCVCIFFFCARVCTFHRVFPSVPEPPKKLNISVP